MSWAGWEADDLIGTISRRCEAAGWDCRVATGDKDSLQLVTDHTYVELVTTRMGKTTTQEMDPGAFRAAYGFAPAQMVDLKALMGDSSDNVPGVPGVGEKTALTLLHENGTLTEIYARLEAGTLEAKPGVKKKLEAGKRAPFSPTTCAPSAAMRPWILSPNRRCAGRRTGGCCGSSFSAWVFRS